MRTPSALGPTRSVFAERSLRLRSASWRVWAATGFAGSVLVAAGSWRVAALPRVNGTGGWLAGTLGLPGFAGRDGLVSMVVFFLGMALLAAGWLGLWWTTRRRPGGPVAPGPGAVLAVLALWCVPLLVAPPVGSRDVYAYAAQGELAHRGLDPYRLGPNALGPGVLRSSVDPMWRSAPAPYGPAFVEIASVNAAVTGSQLKLSVLGLRLVALAGLGLAAWFLPELARGLGRDPAEVLVLALGSPFVLVHLVSGAHNEALMVGLLVAALALDRRGRTLAAVMVCALAIAVKLPAILALGYLGWRWAGPAARWPRRVVTLAAAGAVSLAVMVAVSVVTASGWGWLGSLGNASTVNTWLTASSTVGILAGRLASVVGLDVADPALGLVRMASMAVGAVAAGVLLWRSPVLGLPALAKAYLVFFVLAPVVHPWYLAPAVVLFALAGNPDRRLAFVVGVLVLALATWPDGAGLTANLGEWRLPVVAPGAVLAVWAAWRYRAEWLAWVRLFLHLDHGRAPAKVAS